MGAVLHYCAGYSKFTIQLSIGTTNSTVVMLFNMSMLGVDVSKASPVRFLEGCCSLLVSSLMIGLFLLDSGPSVYHFWFSDSNT